LAEPCDFTRVSAFTWAASALIKAQTVTLVLSILKILVALSGI